MYWLVYDRIPLTKLLMVTNILTLIVLALTRWDALVYYLGFSTLTFVKMPWTAITYPFVNASGSALGAIFSLFWLWIAGGSLERGWGTTRFARFFFAMSAISAGGLALGGFLGAGHVATIGLLLPLAGVTVAFAMLNPEDQVLFAFVLPMKLKYLAVISVLMVLVSYGGRHWMLGITALAGCAYSYWYVLPRSRSRVRPRSTSEPDNVVRIHPKASLLGSLNFPRRIREARERKKLRDLFKRSGLDD